MQSKRHIKHIIYNINNKYSAMSGRPTRQAVIDRAMDEQILPFLRHPTWSLNEQKMAPNQCLDDGIDPA